MYTARYRKVRELVDEERERDQGAYSWYPPKKVNVSVTAIDCLCQLQDF